MLDNCEPGRREDKPRFIPRSRGAPHPLSGDERPYFVNLWTSSYFIHFWLGQGSKRAISSIAGRCCVDRTKHFIKPTSQATHDEGCGDFGKDSEMKLTPKTQWWKMKGRSLLSTVGRRITVQLSQSSRLPGFVMERLQASLCSPLGASLMPQSVKNPPAMQETWVWSLGWEDPLEKGKATYPLQSSGLENSMD